MYVLLLVLFCAKNSTVITFHISLPTATFFRPFSIYSFLSVQSNILQKATYHNPTQHILDQRKHITRKCNKSQRNISRHNTIYITVLRNTPHHTTTQHSIKHRWILLHIPITRHVASTRNISHHKATYRIPTQHIATECNKHFTPTK